MTAASLHARPAAQVAAGRRLVGQLLASLCSSAVFFFNLFPDASCLWAHLERCSNTVDGWTPKGTAVYRAHSSVQYEAGKSACLVWRYFAPPDLFHTRLMACLLRLRMYTQIETP